VRFIVLILVCMAPEITRSGSPAGQERTLRCWFEAGPSLQK